MIRSTEDELLIFFPDGSWGYALSKELAKTKYGIVVKEEQNEEGL